MNTIKVSTQKELDNLPEKFNEFTVIQIDSKETIVITEKHFRENSTVKAYGNSKVAAWDNSKVVAYGNSTVAAWDNSTVAAWGNSTVVAYGNSTVEAWGNSKVAAWDNSTVVAYGNSTVEAWGNSKVAAWDNSTVAAWGNSTVVAYGNSKVVAYGNSKVAAWDNSTVAAWGNSTVVAYGNSKVVAYGNSTVVARDNSTVKAYFLSTVYVKSSGVKIQKLYDKSTAKFCDVYHPNCIQDKHKTAQIVKPQKELSFETYLERGYVKADGIMQKLVKRKKAGSIEVFEVENFGKPNSFVIKKGDIFSHGKTVEEAKADLKYKISSRDTSEFKKWKLTDKKSVEDLIKAYRAITGACEFGTKLFCQNQKLKSKYTIKEVIELTKGQYGSKQFEEFFI